MYDAIVVGARCAGASTARLLARGGYRVLLLDRSRFPSDLPLSTHLIWQSGAAKLQRWGLLEKIRATNCPPLATCSADFGPFTLTGSPPPADGVAEAYAPRRRLLDEILVDAATEAGAELRDGFTVTDVVADGERVIGIRGHDHDGSTVTETAPIVVGADGMHSAVAKAVRAAEYNTHSPFQGTYFTYWSGVPMKGIELYLRHHRALYGWRTNDGLALIGVNWAIGDFPEVRGDIAGHYLTVLDKEAPELAERVRAGNQESRWIGGSIPSYVRKPWGSGWALVGDAAYQKDPCTAQGISDAFRDAELLADAIDAGLSGRQSLDAALADYQAQRDRAAMPMYEFTCQLAPFAPPSPDMLQVYAALPGNQPAIDDFFGVMAGTVTVPHFFSPENIQRLLSAAEARSARNPGGS